MKKSKKHLDASRASRRRQLVSRLALPADIGDIAEASTVKSVLDQAHRETSYNHPSGIDVALCIPIDKHCSCSLRDGKPLFATMVSGRREHPNRMIRRSQLKEIVPLADTTIYEMEQRGEFPRRFYLTPRCVVWDLGEVEAWVVERRQASDTANVKRAPTPDVRRRRTRPVTR